MGKHGVEGHKLVFEDAVQICGRYHWGGESQAKLAAEFNLHQTTVGEICRGEYWAGAVEEAARRAKGGAFGPASA